MMEILTHSVQNEMAELLQMTFFKCIFLNKDYGILIQISLQLVCRGHIDE